MSYCGPRGIAWGAFLQWDRLSRNAAVAWARRNAETCTSCGTHPDTWDPTRGGSEHALVAVIDACRGCATLQSGQQQLTDDMRKQGGHVRFGPPARPEGA